MMRLVIMIVGVLVLFTVPLVVAQVVPSETYLPQVYRAPSSTFTPTVTPLPTQTPSPTTTLVPSATPTELPPPPTLDNPSFEEGATGWIQSSRLGHALIQHRDRLPVPPFDGDWAVMMGGNAEEAILEQTDVLVPEGYPYLHFRWGAVSSEPDCTRDYVQIFVNSDSTQLPLCIYRQSQGWRAMTLDLTQWEGSSVRIAFRVVTDENEWWSEWYLDAFAFTRSQAFSDKVPRFE